MKTTKTTTETGMIAESAARRNIGRLAIRVRELDAAGDAVGARRTIQEQVALVARLRDALVVSTILDQKDRVEDLREQHDIAQGELAAIARGAVWGHLVAGETTAHERNSGIPRLIENIGLALRARENRAREDAARRAE